MLYLVASSKYVKCLLKIYLKLQQTKTHSKKLGSFKRQDVFRVKLITDHSFIEQYNRKRAPLKHFCRCLLENWKLGQNLLGRICNRRGYCSWTDTFSSFYTYFKYINNRQYFVFKMFLYPEGSLPYTYNLFFIYWSYGQIIWENID